MLQQRFKENICFDKENFFPRAKQAGESSTSIFWWMFQVIVYGLILTGKRAQILEFLKQTVIYFFAPINLRKGFFQKNCSKDGCQGRNKLRRTSKNPFEIAEKPFFVDFLSSLWRRGGGLTGTGRESPPAHPPAKTRTNCVYAVIFYMSIARSHWTEQKLKARFMPSFPSIIPYTYSFDSHR